MSCPIRDFQRTIKSIWEMDVGNYNKTKGKWQVTRKLNHERDILIRLDTYEGRHRISFLGIPVTYEVHDIRIFTTKHQREKVEKDPYHLFCLCLGQVNRRSKVTVRLKDIITFLNEAKELGYL